MLSTIVLVPTLVICALGTPIIDRGAIVREAHAEQFAVASIEKRAAIGPDAPTVWPVETRADEQPHSPRIWAIEKRVDEDGTPDIWLVEKRADEDGTPDIWLVERRAPVVANPN